MMVYITTFSLAKAYIAAFFLILPFAHGEFWSARELNLCNQLYSVGFGWGRTQYKTQSAMCNNEKVMLINCRYTRPTNDFRTELHECPDEESCVPHHYLLHGASSDAGCLVLPKSSGVKGDGDLDNHACSSGIRLGDHDLYVLSSVTPDSMLYKDGIRTCIIGKSGSNSPADRIYQKSPCPQTSTILKLAAHTTYQACIYTAVGLAKKSVGFHWNIRSPGKMVLPRGLEQQGKPFSEMFTILNNNTANDAVRIVIGDQESGDQEIGDQAHHTTTESQ
ncbi:hypothetical protein EG328_011493 [Venturia inaequalis]|uniref:Uncharacterized protein n=1 Tax=Venturia inaequalis TaxID=5025 RepID=A0A8H3UHR1_VENIN|nr:hypothetical protein EG328_011493 [Venturia inaequalis]KAE9969870.1 hypothetical protein EG327_010439 [Venturia inaequalis]RDI82653.1 hypothetical protein Vi05172_g7445 [Venturia inaequalis]